jgi:hypothetical protein
MKLGTDIMSFKSTQHLYYLLPCHQLYQHNALGGIELSLNENRWSPELIHGNRFKKCADFVTVLFRLHKTSYNMCEPGKNAGAFARMLPSTSTNGAFVVRVWQRINQATVVATLNENNLVVITGQSNYGNHGRLGIPHPIAWAHRNACRFTPVGLSDFDRNCNVSKNFGKTPQHQASRSIRSAAVELLHVSRRRDKQIYKAKLTGACLQLFVTNAPTNNMAAVRKLINY